MKLTMNLQDIEAAASKVYSAALKSLNFKYESRQQLSGAIVNEAKAAGYAGDDVRWIASRGLAWSGYGGGL